MNESMIQEGREVPTGRLVGRLLGMVWKYRWGCIRTLSLQAVLLALGLSGLGLTGVGVDFLRQIIAERAGGTGRPPRWPAGLVPPPEWHPLMVIGLLSLAILAFAALRALLNMYYAISMNKLLQGRIVVDLRSRVYAKLQQLSFRFFDANASSGIINRVTGDVQAVRGFVDGVVLQAFVLALSLAIYLVYMLNIHGPLTMACLVTTPLLWIATVRFSRKVRPAYTRNRELFDNLILALSESIQGAHVIKGFSRGKEEIEKFTAINDSVRSQKRWIFRQQAFFQPLVGFLTQINLVVLLGYGGLLVMRQEQTGMGGISVGQLLVFAGLLQQFSGQVASISGIADSMQQSLTAAQRVFEILDAPVSIQSPPGAISLPAAKGAVRFDDVSFHYREETPLLHRVSLDIEPGMRVAILGATGAGKTTLLSLIPRFYDATAGAVRVDGHDVRELDLADLRRGIGIVFQDNFLFSNTVRANIAFGHPDATDERIERAARMASAHDFIMELPKGYDTLLREAGGNLSGGQRQRLAIARALLLDPPILLLDDPTAAVDAETEADIMQAIEQAMGTRTVLIVAHRLSAMRRADRVVVLERGRIVQTGHHDDLMREDGHYRRVVQLQVPDAESVRLLGEAWHEG